MSAVDHPPAGVTPQQILRELDEAIKDQMVWLKTWHRALLENDGDAIERLAAGEDDLRRFGAWYARHHHMDLVDQPAVRTLAGMHGDMHARARALARSFLTAGRIDGPDYDRFMDTAAAFLSHARRLEKAFAQASSDLDPLTGVHNRKSMTLHLQREHARAVRLGRPCAVALADLDRFKSVNDTYGHAVGDRVLMTVAERLVGAIRPYDTVFRFGGEEFLLCLPDASAEVAEKVLGRVLDTLRSRPIPLPGGQSLSVTCSFGVTQFDGECDIDHALRRADQALYAAKTAGRNRVCLWTRGNQDEISGRDE